MTRYRYFDMTKGSPLYVVKQSWRNGIPWVGGPYHTKYQGEMIYGCDAPDILAADFLFYMFTGGRRPNEEFMTVCRISESPSQ